MKKIIITLSLLIIGFTSYSQEHLKLLKYYKVAFHIVRTSAGTTNITGLELDIQKAIKYMNDKFIGANIQFYICGINSINYIDNDTYFNISGDLSSITGAMAPYRIENAINVFLFNSMVDDLWGFSSTPDEGTIAVRHEVIQGQLVTVTHEFGHFFWLSHTHSGGNEFVTRGESANCTTAGDGFCDTPADPNLEFETYVDENCDYTGTMVDARGDTYDPDVTLIMSYARHKCRTRFSQEQLARMNLIATQGAWIVYSHMQYFENTAITTDYDIEEDVILIKNTKIENNAEVRLKPCAFVEISGDSEVKLGSTLDITIE
ncbi:MAG: M43 family zinc metalloprotease [Bacteroidales bacterium]